MNTNELKATMKRHGDTQEKLAEALDLQVSGVNERVNGKVEFRRSEINTIRERYNLSPEETIKIFFA
jgi:transcriptional regulator with XRE-family HTH domain